ncbi:DegT/DnrJ/EryC1/StrS family aminotransferase, partial [Photobacterium sanctipauli]
YNYSYFPVFVSGGLEKRDEVLKRLQNNGVIARKYFYPLVSDFEGFAKSRKLNLKNAEDISNSILCLPLHSELN